MLILAESSRSFPVKSPFLKAFDTHQVIVNHRRVAFKHSAALKRRRSSERSCFLTVGEQEARQQALPPLQPCAQWAAFVRAQRKACVKTVDTLPRAAIPRAHNCS